MNLLNIFRISFVFYVMYSYKTNVKAFVTVYNANGMVIIAMENEYVDIECKSGNTPVAYCGFLHPSGKRWSFTVKNEDTYNCTKVFKISKADVGPWRCYIGTRRIGEELYLNIKLRLSNELSAVEPDVQVVSNGEAQLLCVPTKNLTPITYCRFEPPKALPFRIDWSFNKKNALEKKYYYPYDMSFEKGDCAVRIMNVNEEDEGIWTCSVGVDDKHYSDYVKLHVANSSNMTVYITLIALGLSLLSIVSIAVIAMKHPSALGTRQNVRHAAEEVDFHVSQSSLRTVRSVSNLNRL